MKNSKRRRPRRRWSSEEKSEIVREYQRSGDSISEFARHRQVGISSLRSWIEMHSGERVDGAAFVELTGLMPDADRGEYQYEISLASGHTLRLRRGFDSREVQAIVAALAGNA